MKPLVAGEALTDRFVDPSGLGDEPALGVDPCSVTLSDHDLNLLRSVDPDLRLRRRFLFGYHSHVVTHGSNQSQSPLDDRVKVIQLYSMKLTAKEYVVALGDTLEDWFLSGGDVVFIRDGVARVYRDCEQLFSVYLTPWQSRAIFRRCV